MAHPLVFNCAQFSGQPQRLLRGAAAFLTTMGASLLLLCFAPPELGSDVAVIAGCGFLLCMAGVAALLLSFTSAGDHRRHVRRRVLRRSAAVAMVHAASFLVYSVPESSGDANDYCAVMAVYDFLVWTAGVALRLFSLTAAGNRHRHLPQRLLRRSAAVAMLFSASFLAHGITYSSANATYYYAVVAGCSALLWMAGVALLLFFFLVRLDEQPDVRNHQRLLRACASAMGLAASFLGHGIPESDGNAGYYGVAVMEGCFFLMWTTGVALLLISLVL